MILNGRAGGKVCLGEWSLHAVTGKIVTSLTVAACALMLVAGCGNKPEQAAPVEERVNVEIFSVQPAPFTQTYRVTAAARPIRAYHLSAEVSGTVVEIKADVGDYVEQGVVLARFDREPLTLMRDTRKAELKRAAVRLELALRDYARKEGLHKQGSISDSMLDEAELAVTLAEADHRLAQLALQNAARDLRNTVITAPAAGEITRRFPELGTVVSPGAPLFHLARTDRVRLMAGLSEQQVVHVTEGGKAEVRFDALPDERFTGDVVSVGSVDEPGTATFPVEVHLDNPERRIRPGMVARVVLPGRTIPAALFVPAVALRKGVDGIGLFAIEKGRAVHRTVEVAALVDEMAIISRGLVENDRVVVVGQTTLKGGEPVAIIVLNGKRVGDAGKPALYSLP